jgi:hypothetical protein
MFKYPKIELRFLKDNKSQEPTPEPTPKIDVDAFAKTIIKQVVISGVIILATSVVLNTLGAIAVTAMENAHND